MIKHTLRAVFVIILLAGVTAAAGAQQDTTRKVPRTQDTVRKESRGEVATPAPAANFASLMSAVNAATATTEKISALTALKAEQIRLVDAKDLVTSANETEFNSAYSQNKAGVEALQAALQKNEAIAKAIADHPTKPAVSDVIAADVSSAGDVVIYFRRKG
jgi:hypothetical protein